MHDAMTIFNVQAYLTKTFTFHGASKHFAGKGNKNLSKYAMFHKKHNILEKNEKINDKTACLMMFSIFLSKQ